MKSIFFKGIVLLLLVGCSSSENNLATFSNSSMQKSPNIIYILADDLGYAELGSYGQEKIKTPFLDQLATEGMRFTDSYSGAAVCAPSRGTLLTGKHTGHAYVRDNYELGGYADDQEGGQLPLPENTITLGTFLQEQGYTTGIIGKWGLGGPDTSGIPNKQGFDFFYGYLCQKQAHNYYPTHLWKNETSIPLNNPVFSAHQRFEGDPNNPSDFDNYKGNDYAATLMAEEVENFIRANAKNPFFLYYAIPIPHLALQVPDEYLSQYQFEETPYLGNKGYTPHQKPLAAYAAMISYMDAQIGALMNLLQELNLDENTLIVFTSDNGTTHDVGGVDSNFFESVGPLRDRKGALYEGGIRVPMIARWKGTIKPNTTSNVATAMWDFFPTIADLLHQSMPTSTDGVSILPTLLGKSNQASRDFLYWENHGYKKGQQAVRFGNWKAIRINVHNNPDAPIELYNLSEDIGEANNVASEHPDLVAKAQAFMNTRTLSHIQQWNFERYHRGQFGRE